MTARALASDSDPIRPAAASSVTIRLEGEPLVGIEGQTIAGILLASGRMSWRTTAVRGTPRGLFCGIGVCYDCILEVNGVRDVRACQRIASDGDEIRCQDETLPSRGTEKEER